MVDESFLRMLAAGLGVALVAGPMGCFLVWRRMAYFGAMMSHSALLGWTLAGLLRIEPMLGVFAVGAGAAPLLLALERRGGLASDTLLAILAHGALALGLLATAILALPESNPHALIVGDMGAASAADIAAIYLVGAAIIAALVLVWRPLLASTVSDELARAEGLAPDKSRLVYMLAMAGLVAMAMKIVGVLLIVSLLMIPPAAARRFARTPEEMALGAAGIGALSVICGLIAARMWDLPSGPAIVIAALVFFAAGLLPTPMGRPWNLGRAPKNG